MYKVGEKISCHTSCKMIDGPRTGKIAVSKGKVYTVLKIHIKDNRFAVEDDLFQEHWFQIDESRGKKTHFHSLKESRKQKIKKLSKCLM